MSNPNTDTVEAVARAMPEVDNDDLPPENFDHTPPLPCPFCGGPAKTYQFNGTTQATCAASFVDCAGSDVGAPVGMWNRRAAIAAMPGSGEAMREAAARVIEDNTIAYSAGGSSLQPRGEGDKNGLAFAAAIRALPLPQGGRSVVPAVEPYAYLCTASDLLSVVVHRREDAEIYAAHSERWTVEPLYRGPKLAPPLPPAQEG